jgi:uncharacterized membrane protein YoaK (UPF0700 family)
MSDRQRVVILLLAAAGAGVDAVMLLTFGVLTAAQTGNTILLAVAIAHRQWGTGLAAAVSVGGYVAGAALGERVLEGRGARSSGAPLVTSGLLLELLLLAVALLVWRFTPASAGPGGQSGLAALAAIAMGVQSAVTIRLHAGPGTTYVTGTLTTFTIETIRSVRGGARRQFASADLADHPPRAGLYGATWAVYLAAAVAAALLGGRAGSAALLLPIALLTLVVLMRVGAPPRGTDPH